MKKLKLILLGILFTFPFQQQAQSQEAKITVSKSIMGNGVAVFKDGSYRIVGALAQPFRQNPGNLKSEQFWYLPVQVLTTEIDEKTNAIPIDFRLDQNYPNPFNPTTTIQFALPEPAAVTLKLFDILGREVTTLFDKEMESGVHKLLFDAKDFASGVYFYRIRAESTSGSQPAFVRSKKLIFLQ
ncbi:MAG: T9SS type A sorting domain-containing protein [bacterium]